MLEVVWSGINYGYVKNPALPTVLPFVVSEEKDCWQILLHGGVDLKGRGDLPDDIDEAILWLYRVSAGGQCSRE